MNIISQKYLLTIFIVFFYQIVFTQSKFSSSTNTEISNNGITLTSLERKALFTREFTTALSDVSSNYIGNFATLNIGGTKASFANTYVKEGSVFGFNISGSTADGTLRLINNNKLNYNFDVGFQYHFIDKLKKIKFYIDVNDLDSKRLQRKKILADTKKKIDDLQRGSLNKALLKRKKTIEDSLEVMNQKINYIESSGFNESIDKDLLKVKIDGIDKQLKDLQDYLSYKRGLSTSYKTKKDKELKRLENCFSDKCIQDIVQLQNDIIVKRTLLNESNLKTELGDLVREYRNFDIVINHSELNTEKAKLAIRLANTSSEIQNNDNSILLLQNIESSKRRIALNTHDENVVQTYGSHFSWFSIGAKTGLKTFALYDPDAADEEQLKSEENYSLELTLQYSWHSYNQLKQWRSYLINSGIGISYGDNLSSLNSLTLIHETIISQSNGLSRTTKKETNVFVGDYKDNIAGLKIYTDIYYFLFKGNIAALHLYPTASFSQYQEPLFSTQIGLLFSYKNKDKPTTIINAELFYSFNDIGNRTNTELNFLGRNTLGLRLTVPLNFKYKL